VETTQIFGAKTAVCNYDIMGNTIRSLALSVSRIPPHLVHRQLHDVPVVAPGNSGWCEEFSKNYQEMCESVGVKLAPPCPNKDKAFVNSTSGKVLGIEFCTEKLSWKLPLQKCKKYANQIADILAEGEVGLEECESLVGRLNFITCMEPALRTFKKPAQNLLSILKDEEMGKIPLSQEVIDDLFFWWHFLTHLSWLPISEDVHHPPPLLYKTFTTDVAGWSADESGRGRIGAGHSGSKR
jgi:hypothetical protein